MASDSQAALVAAVRSAAQPLTDTRADDDVLLEAINER